MRIEGHDDQPDPSEVQPTDNSSGVPVDLERLDDLEESDAADQP
jgi:hypothetical protein